MKNKKFYNKTQFNEFKKLLNISRSKLIESNLFYDSGLVYIKGIRGISFIFLIFGSLFYVLYNNSMCVYEIKQFIYIYKHPVYFIFFVGIRYAPRVLFSCSGYTLFYKFYCYLEEKKEENEVKNNMNKKESKNNNENNKKTKMIIFLKKMFFLLNIYFILF